MIAPKPAAEAFDPGENCEFAPTKSLTPPKPTAEPLSEDSMTDKATFGVNTGYVGDTHNADGTPIPKPAAEPLSADIIPILRRHAGVNWLNTGPVGRLMAESMRVAADEIAALRQRLAEAGAGLAAAYEADLNAMGEYANEVGGPVVGWLQKRIASLRQGGSNEKGRS